MTPTLVEEIRTCALAAEALGSPALAERLRSCAETLEDMMLLPVLRCVVPPRGRPVLRLVRNDGLE